jgi:hypothetical protein
MAYAGSPSGASDSGFHSLNIENGVISRLLSLRRQTMRWAAIGDERIIIFWRNSIACGYSRETQSRWIWLRMNHMSFPW